MGLAFPHTPYALAGALGRALGRGWRGLDHFMVNDPRSAKSRGASSGIVGLAGWPKDGLPRLTFNAAACGGQIPLFVGRWSAGW